MGTLLSRVRVGWTGPAVVGPGVSTFYTSSAAGTALATGLYTFFQNVTSAFPNLAITWDIPNHGEVIDDATGELAGSWTGGTARSSIAASPNATWVSGVGARMVWTTGAVTRGRAVRGSTFLVPLQTSAYESAGMIVGSFLTLFNAQAALLIAADPQFCVWERPVFDRSGPVPVRTHDGGHAAITSGAVPDRVSWLRSRRT
jgi:hypothetical protein